MVYTYNSSAGGFFGDEMREVGRFLEARRSQWSAQLLVILILLFAGFAEAQTSATLSGIVTDPSGAAVSGAEVTATDLDKDVSRTTPADQAGRYQFFALPLGAYEVRVRKEGFAEAVRTGIHLVLGQDAIAHVTLKLGQVSEEIKVREDVPVVSVTTSDPSGLVGERQVKDLPLNGRSYDLLLPLNPGVVNFTWQKTGGLGVSNSTTGNNFSVSGNRPQQNLFLLNGVEYTGAAENNMQPGGASQELLGVDAVREFNLLRDTYSAEYGKHPGGQVLIATQSGNNQLHGSVYEFLRNNALDAPNYFDQGPAPPFQRNQFGAALGGPIRVGKTFLFGNYEGLRQHLHQTSAAFVPDAASRAAAVPGVQPLLNLWPIAPANAPDFNGIAQVFSSPLQTIREDFGTARLDHVFSSRDSLAAVYTIDDGDDTTATTLNPYSTDLLTLREQVVSVEETHSFSSSTINVARVGFSRAGYFFTGEPTPGTPAATVPGFLLGHSVGAVVVGGSAASNPQAQIGLAGSNNGSNLRVARNLYTFEDRATLVRGRHQISVGLWFQPFQSNENLALSQYGQATFSSLTTFLAGTASSFLYNPSSTALNWRSYFAAAYAEDVIRVKPNLTVSLGFRDEYSSGWNEAHGRAANYTFANSVISSQPRVANSLFTTNHARFLPQPRMGIAWSPASNNKTVFRAGFGIYNDLQDALGYRADQNGPFNPTYSIPSLAVSSFPIDPTAPVPTTAKLVPGGVQPDLKTPMLISWSLRVERELSPNTSLTVGYIGSHGYHELIGIDAQPAIPDNLSGIALPGNLSQQFSRAACGRAGSERNVLYPVWSPQSEPDLGQYLDLVLRRRQQLQRAASGFEPPLQPRIVVARCLHLVEGSRQWRLAERHDCRECARAGIESLQPQCRLWSRHLRREAGGCHQCCLQTALRTRPGYRRRCSGLARQTCQWLVCKQHRRRTSGIPLYSAVELQPIE